MKQHQAHSPLLAVLTGLALASSAPGQLFSDDFESYPPDTFLDTSGPWGTAGIGDANVLVLDDLTDTPFGTLNQYLDFNDDSTSASVRVQSPNIAAASGALTTFSFDFNEPSAGEAGNLIIGYSITSGDLNSAGRRIAMNLDDGTVTGLSSAADNTYLMDATYTIYVVFNDTASPVDYAGGSLDPGVADVWLQASGEAPVFAGTRDAYNSQTASYRVGLRSFSGNLQQVFVDNVTLRDGIALPGVPVLASTSPADGASQVATGADLVATFDRLVVPGTGFITIKQTSNDATVAMLDVTNPAEVVFSSSTVTIDLPSDLGLSTGYYVVLDATAVQNVLGDPFPGISAKTEWNFTTSADSTPPSLLTTNPADNAAAVAIDVSFVATFDEAIAPGAGNIVITNLTEATTFATIDIGDATQVTVAGSTLTIDPADDLHEGRTYAVEIDSGAITDSTGNPFAGIAGIDNWDFDTVPDTTDPALVSTTPADNATAASFGNNLTATFDEAIQAGTGDITIVNLADSSTFATIPMGDAQVSIAGSTLTIDPDDVLEPGTAYAVQIDAAAITDLSGNTFAGIVAPDVATWNFTTTTLTSKDSIVGESEANGPAEDYYPNANNNMIGVGGPGGGRADRNVVLGYTLPTLPVGEKAGSVNFFFEITAARDSTGAENLPNLQVHLLDVGDPDASGVSYFFHGFNDTAPDVALVGTTSVTVTGTADTNFADDSQDRVFALSGDALALLQSFYGDDHIPDQTEVFFRFSLDPDPAVNTYRRYRIDLGDHESGLQVSSVPPTPPVIVSTVPADDAIDVYEGTSFVATFDRDILAGSGDITIRDVTDGTTFESIPVTDDQVSISGPDLVIALVNPLDPAEEYAIQLDAGVVTDATGNPFAGIVDPDVTTWSFTTGTTFAEELNTIDFITGRAQIDGQTPGYYSGGNGQVGAGGGAGARVDRNVVLGFTLPTLPAGSTPTAAVLNFEITAYRNHSGADPALNVYLLDSADPSTTGTDFFYHGPSDSNPNVRFVGATDLTAPQGDQVSYDFDEQDQSHTLTGGALALLRSFYGGDHIPDQPTVFFRFNLDNLVIGTGDAELNGATFDRYFIEPDPSQSILEVTSGIGGGGDTFASWISGFSVGGMTGVSDDPDGDGNGNGVENFLGTAPDTASQGLVSATASGGEFTFTHQQSASPAGDLTAAYVWSKDLATPFNADGSTDGDGTKVTFTMQLDTPSAGITTVTANVTGTATDKLFVRLEVTQN
jgi:methionine-rich copper-binding protein CopC